MGGLSGCVFELFDFAGKLFFTILIGSERARRLQIRNSRVRVGAFIITSLVSTGIIYFLTPNPNERRIFSETIGNAIICGLFSGLIFGVFILASILLSYIKHRFL